MNEVRNGEQKEQKYLYFDFFMAVRDCINNFVLCYSKDTSLLTC